MNLFCFFHLNLAFSSIEEGQRAEVIEKCYWPILRIAERLQIPLGIEATGYTLTAIAGLDPEWIRVFRGLVNDGPCELIGSGLTQMIGPLVPARVTEANLRLGNSVYEELIGIRPRVALLGEQAFSAGLVPLYRDAGFEALIAEWNNAAQAHPEWPRHWRHYPQRAAGTDGDIPVIWNESIAFQKFQRFVHGESDLEEYLEFLSAGVGAEKAKDGSFLLYGSDAEVFDFRPGRYNTESKPRGESEWARIERLLSLLMEEGRSFVRPSEVLKQLGQAEAGHKLTLGSAALPVPVKKQGKYNLLRWAVTGRNDLDINTRCWRLYEALVRMEGATDSDWAELCFLWSSDFRTHITEARWVSYLERLEKAERRLLPEWPPPERSSRSDSPLRPEHCLITAPDEKLHVYRHGRYLNVEGNRLRVRLNCRRGLALDQFADLKLGPQPLIGTLPHGYFEEIDLGADFYSGHFVFESPGRHKVTDLEEVQPELRHFEGGVSVSAEIATPLGPVRKEWTIDDRRGRLGLEISACLRLPGPGSLRLGHITLTPESFDQSTLFYRTHNGGIDPETFRLGSAEMDHGLPVSTLVTARHAIGITGGVVEIGDSNKLIHVEVDKQESALVGMIRYQSSRSNYLYRLVFSGQELDDTSGEQGGGEIRVRFWISVVSW